MAGFNSRLDELQAAVLRAKLPCLDAENAARRACAAEYLQALQGTPLVLPRVLPGTEPVWHLFVVCSAQRDALQAGLRERGIGTLVHYPLACHRQGAYAGMAWPPLPVAERLQDQVLSLPIAPYLRTPDLRSVAEAVHAACAAAHAPSHPSLA